MPATAAQREAVALAWLVAGPDGPAGDVATAVQGWLAGAGWLLAGPVCPAGAAGELTR